MTNDKARMIKERLRQQMRAEMLRRRSDEAASAQIIVRLKEQPIWQKSRSVLFFSALPGEPDLRALCADALAEGKVVAFPRHIEASDSYAAFCVKNLETELSARGRFGIAEPTPACAEFPLNKLDFVLVPGIAFAINGARLGRGKGYFDRLLAQVAGTRCGVAFDWQILPAIPTEAHDIFVDCLVTPTQWRVFRDVVNK